VDRLSGYFVDLQPGSKWKYREGRSEGESMNAHLSSGEAIKQCRSNDKPVSLPLLFTAALDFKIPIFKESLLLLYFINHQTRFPFSP
jgi:hypothetical protein